MILNFQCRAGIIFCAVACLLLLAGCRPQGAPSGLSALPSPPPPPTTVPPVAPPVPTAYPAVPAILPKPRILGAAYPPVIALPNHIAQPWIRVRITGELVEAPWINPRLYAGRIRILHLADGRYAAVNVLPLEDYLAGVLARELYRNWAPATYRAQAIAARTYALYQMQTFGRDHAWDVTGGPNSQVYGGRAAETPRALQAVALTRGEVLYTRQDGRVGIFCAYYSACNGGASQSAAAAWGDRPVRPLVNRVTGTLDANCPLFSWGSRRYSKAFLTRAIRWWGRRNALPYLADLGRLASVRITRRNAATGRPMIITVTDLDGHVGKMRAEEFRLALALYPKRKVPAPPSSFFKIRDEGHYILLVDGHGFGHGVGLSQWGAQALALAGHSASYILSFYYPGSWIHRLYGK